MEKGKKSFILKALTVLLCLCVLSYTVYHLASLFAEDISTIVVGPTTEYSTLSVDGYIFRDTADVYSSYSGAVDYAVSDGEKVAVGDKLADVFESGNTSGVRGVLALLDRQISLLESSVSANYSISDLAELKSTASGAYYAIMKMLASGEIGGISQQCTKMLSALNAVSLLTDDDFAIEETLETLKSTKASILDAGGQKETVSTDRSGYFYYDVDGYEGAFTGEAARTLDAAELRRLTMSTRSSVVQDTCIGKIAYSADWYFIVSVGDSRADTFEEGGSYTLNFTGGGSYEIPMTLERLLKVKGEPGAVLVFITDYAPDGFGFERVQNVEIVLRSVSGIYVPMSATHRVRSKDCVYILCGSVVQLRYIDIIYEGSDYYIVRDEVPSEGGHVYLKSNDLLITNGSNLFDGRILD